MSQRKIVVEPDPILRKKSEILEKVDDELRRLLDDMLEKTNNVIAKVADELPNDFPNAIAEPIFKGIQATADRLGG